jgi:hypothetical protein
MRFLWYRATAPITWAAAVIGTALATGYPAAQPATKGTRPPALPAAVLQRTRPIFDGKSLDGWVQVPAGS